MAIFFRAVVTAFLVLTMNSLALLTNQDLHPDNNTLVAKLKGYYAVIDSLEIGDIGSRIKIQQKSISTDYLPTNDPECNGFWVTVDDQPVMPYVAWALGNKFFSSMSEQQLRDTPIYRAYLRMFQKSNNNRIVDMSLLKDQLYKKRVQQECTNAEVLSRLYKRLETERDRFWRDFAKGNYSVMSHTHASTPSAPVQLTTVAPAGSAVKSAASKTIVQAQPIEPDRLTYNDILNGNIQLNTSKGSKALIQISDTHEFDAQTLARGLNSLRWQLKDKDVKVIVVGDIANKDVQTVGREYIKHQILRAGDYFVTGNHDAHKTSTYLAFIKSLNQMGIHWLCNSAISSLTGYNSQVDSCAMPLAQATHGNSINIGDCPTQHCYGLSDERGDSQGKLQYANNIDPKRYNQLGTSSYKGKWYHQAGLYYAPLYASQYDGPWNTQSKKFSFSKMIKHYLGIPRLINHYPDISTDDNRKTRMPKSLLQRLDLKMCNPFNKNTDSRSDWTTGEDSYNLFALTQYVQLMYAIAQQINSHPGDEIITVNFAWHDAGLTLYYVLQQLSAIIYADALNQPYATYVNEQNKSANRGRFGLYGEDNKRFLRRLIPGLPGSLIADSSQLKRVNLNIIAGHDHNEAIKSLQETWSCFHPYQSSYFKGLKPGVNGVLVGSLPIWCAGNDVVDLSVTIASCKSPGHQQSTAVYNRDLYVWYYN